MYSIHICQLHQSSELLQWWPDCIMNLSCASSLTCSRLCRCYPLRKDCVDILVLWKWMNSIISVSPCESFWGVICLTAQILLPQMNGCFEAMMAVPAPRTHTHTHTQSSNDTVGNYKPPYWLTNFNIRSRLYRRNTKSDKYKTSSQRTHGHMIYTLLQFCFDGCIVCV